MRKILLSTIVATTLINAQEQLPYEISFTIGGTTSEGDLKLQDHKNYGIRLGINNQFILPNVFDTIEFIYERSNDAEYENTALDTNINRYSVNLLHHYRNYESITPYALMGVGYEDFSKKIGKVNDSVTTNIGLGIKYNIDTNWNLRAELRDQINLESDIEHNMIYTLGLGYSFGETKIQQISEEPKYEPRIDDDNDGIANEYDNCPNSPLSADVDKNGCQIDSDKDGIYDESDLCPTTPRGASVDSNGCALDSDKDGVIDLNDKCPNTLKGFNVDSNGCAINYNFKVEFDTDKTNIKDKYIPKLTKFVDFMNMKVNYKAQIQGFTDSVGSAKYNLDLSTRRAKSVMNKLIELGIEKNRLSYKGFGQKNPIASNDTQEGKEANRRVEAKIQK